MTPRHRHPSARRDPLAAVILALGDWVAEVDGPVQTARFALAKRLTVELENYARNERNALTAAEHIRWELESAGEDECPPFGLVRRLRVVPKP